MTGPTRTTYTLRDNGADLSVEAWHDGKRNRARLLVDGVESGTGECGELEKIEFGGGTDRHVRVTFGIRKGHVSRCVLLETTKLSVGRDVLGGRKYVHIPFLPPTGTRAARRYELEKQHPYLYASRHVAVQVGSILFVVFGVGALTRALLGRLVPNVSWEWLPNWEFDPPEWLKYLNPWRYLRPVVEFLFGWVPDIDLPDLPNVGWLRYVAVVLFAIGLAVEEVRRRKKRDAEEPDADRRP